MYSIKNIAKDIIESENERYNLNNEISFYSIFSPKHNNYGFKYKLTIPKNLRASGWCMPKSLNDKTNVIVINKNFIKSIFRENQKQSLVLLVRTCYHECYHLLQFDKLEKSNSNELNEETFNFLKEKLITHYFPNTYEKLHNQLMLEMEAHEYSIEESIKYLPKLMPPAEHPDVYEHLNQRLGYIKNSINMFTGRETSKEIAKLIARYPHLIKENSFLELEYNPDGSHKNLNQLLLQKDNSKFENLTKHLICERILNYPDELVNNYSLYDKEQFDFIESSLYNNIKLLNSKIKTNEQLFNDKQITKDMYDENANILMRESKLGLELFNKNHLLKRIKTANKGTEEKRNR